MPANASRAFDQVGTPSFDLPSRLATDGTNGVFVIGTTEGALARPNPKGQSDGFLIR